MDVEKEPLRAELPPLGVVIRQHGKIVARIELPDPRTEFVTHYNRLNRQRGRIAEPQTNQPQT